MPQRSLRAIVVFVAMCAVPYAIAQVPQPPEADVRKTELTAHGHTRIDNYFWLRDRNDRNVLEYLRAENDYLDAVMADTKPLEAKLYQEIIARIKQDDSSVPFTENGQVYYTRYEEGQQYPYYCRRRDQAGSVEEVMLDVNQLAKGHTFCAVPGVKVNRSNNLAAFAVDTVGRRIYTLRVKDLASGEMLSDHILTVTDNFVWAEDGQTLFYTRQDPETLRPYQIYRHMLGSDAGTDALVYEEKDDTFRCSIRKSRSKKYLLIESTHTLSTEYRFLDANKPLGDFQVFEPRRRDHEYSVDHLGDDFYVRTNDQAKNFRLVKTKVATTTQENWQEVVPHRQDVLLERFSLFSQFLVLEERRRGLTHVRIIPWSGAEEHELDFGEPAYSVFAAPTPEPDTAVLRFGYTSLTTPWSVYDYDMNTRGRTLRKRQPVLGDFDPANYVTERLTVNARDGAEVPISVMYRKGISRSGKNPCLLYGYGSYGITCEPTFRMELLTLVDRGFVFSIAHIRGGQELGRQWYEDGKLLKKMNTFTDFIDCAEFLVKDRLADPHRLFAKGGSAGGLVMGAVTNMRPDLFTGVIANVPFVDVVTTMLDDSIPLTTAEYDEWGNPRHREYYEYMLSYSPYDNVVAKDYPNLLVTSGLHDSQVQFWEPTKWVAKLRTMKTDKNLVLLKTDMGSGHGGASGRFERFKLIAIEHAFLLRLAGITD